MIELKNVIKIYNQGKNNEYKALGGISFKINDGEMVAIVGKSGAGKSTILHIIAGIDTYENGEVIINGKIIKELSDKECAKLRNEELGIVMQDFALVEDFSAFENVMLPLDFAQHKKRNKKDIALKALKSVDMDAFSENTVNELSGGQKQRVAIARAIVNAPSIVLADEPTGALDTKTSGEIMMLFKYLKQKGITVVIVTHDINIANQADRIIRIEDGRII